MCGALWCTGPSKSIFPCWRDDWGRSARSSQKLDCARNAQSTEEGQTAILAKCMANIKFVLSLSSMERTSELHICLKNDLWNARGVWALQLACLQCDAFHKTLRNTSWIDIRCGFNQRDGDTPYPTQSSCKFPCKRFPSSRLEKIIYVSAEIPTCIIRLPRKAPLYTDSLVSERYACKKGMLLTHGFPKLIENCIRRHQSATLIRKG